MEKAHGRPLNTVWSSLDIPDKLAVVDEALSIQKRLLTTRNVFGGYGSLYFADDAATMQQNWASRTTCHYHQPEPENNAPVYWHTNISWDPCLQPLGWIVVLDYLTSIAHSSMAHIVTHQDHDTTADRAFSFPINKASDTWASAVSDMLQTLFTAIPYILPRFASQNQPLLWHKDLHFGNLFVSTDGKISCIVDWQDTDILPLFLAARILQFDQVEDNAHLLELLEDFSSMPEARRLELWERYRQSMLQQYYLADLRESVPDLAALLEDRQPAPIRKQVELFSRIPSRQDVDALFQRETLLRIQRRWPDFVLEHGITIQRPIKIESDELINHQADGRRYNKFQDLLEACNLPVADEGLSQLMSLLSDTMT